MVITKVDLRKTDGATPAGFVKVNLDEHIADFKISSDVTGEFFIVSPDGLKQP